MKRKTQQKLQRALLLCSGLALLFGFLLGARGCRQQEEAPPSPVLIRVLQPDGSIAELELEDFLCGVVAAEMPASFAPQALQAQAVAARTYILKQQQSGKHGEAAVCCDSRCCQAWRSWEELTQGWGGQAEHYQEKIRAAVAATAGQVLCYQGELVDGLFCSTCGGMTEDAAAVWGGGRAYLQAKPCPYCSHSPRYNGWKRYSLAEFSSRLGLDAATRPELGSISYTPGGRVASLSLGGKEFSGTELRRLLELDSAAFSYLIQGEDILLLSVGYGHGVGLCQYGADGMGRAGYGYGEILAFYYPGTEIQTVGQ